mmetsp:Transcript_8709/g.32153  ORF Transcript_8709/g.32153 Transcript_8709/m.32153 type:complete len:481 (-) Transcript_8709:95-1537(-)|eukprot:CAMPEP_0117445036 /NCGR_PEP_ID=MMETSP0759-20121206/5571_1 /TAXON_ID=63605 /ORGANISM="Percolomonas cosmopolitus, Strain WS" /LENGTH=480 /DNA_ID=CAMNT_0005237165 /DNA_START=266 /DNA_END=1708 /DNA_ORIENTATION=-
MVSSGKFGKGSASRIPKTFPPGQQRPSAEPPNVLDDILNMQRLEERRKQNKYNKERLEFLRHVEEKYTAYNTSKIKAKYMALMRKVKSKELKKHLEHMERDHERQNMRLDSILQMLFKDLYEAEEQYRLCLKSHQANVDELLNLYEKRVQSIEQDFRRNLTLSKKDHDEEMKYLHTLHDEQVTEMKHILEEMAKRDETENAEIEKEFQIEMKFVANSYSNDFHVMRIEMGKEIKERQQQYKEENESYGKPIAQAYQEYEVLKNKNDELSEIIETQNMQIKKNDRLLAQWKAKWLNNLRESEKRNADLKEEIKQMKGYFVEVKNQMKAFRQTEKRRLATLVSDSRHAQKILQDKLTFAERIINHNLLNKKGETELEREPLSPSEHHLEAEDGENSSMALQDVERLQQYYGKYNKVLLDKAALEQEKVHLLEDNQKLRDMLKAYLDGISVNAEVLSKQNPLVIIQGLNKTHSGQSEKVRVQQ